MAIAPERGTKFVRLLQAKMRQYIKTVFISKMNNDDLAHTPYYAAGLVASILRRRERRSQAARSVPVKVQARPHSLGRISNV